MDNCSKNKEIWKDVVGYEGLYQVSSEGRVKSQERLVANKFGALRPVHEKIKSQRKNNSGYLMVMLYKENKHKNCTVHRLVAEAFLEKQENRNEVNHIDENKENNSFLNLEWVSSSENKTRNGLSKRASIARTKTIMKNRPYDKAVVAVDRNGNHYGFRKIKDAKETFGIVGSDISKICKGNTKRKYCHGMRWFYVEKYYEELL